MRKIRWRGTYICSVWYEDGAGQISADSGTDVDDPDPQASSEFFEVAHQEVLDQYRYDQL